MPVFATLVSTGRAWTTPRPVGVHRIWVKLCVVRHGEPPICLGRPRRATRSQEVPYVQFFDGAVGLHGTYWHRDFGHARSHGCVNLAPLDARRMFTASLPAKARRLGRRLTPCPVRRGHRGVVS